VCIPISADGLYNSGSFCWDIEKEGLCIPEGEYFRTSVVIGVEKNFFNIIGYAEVEQNTDTTKGTFHQFKPYSAEYYARTGVKYGNIYMEYEHLCVHGIDHRMSAFGHDRFTIGFDTRETN
jgi:hypothetical protein